MKYNSASRVFLPILFVVISFAGVNSVLASEITGNLSSAGLNSQQNNTGSIQGEVASATPVVVVASGGGGGGGGGIVIDLAYTHEPGYLNSGGTANNLNLDLLNPNLAYSFTDTPVYTYVAPKAYVYPKGNVAYAVNPNRELAFGGMGGEDLSSATDTNELAQSITPTSVTEIAQTVNETGFLGLSLGAWMLLFVLIILAIMVLYYLREESSGARRSY